MPTSSYSGRGAETLTAVPRQKMEAVSELSCRSPSEMSSNGRGKIFFLLRKHDVLFDMYRRIKRGELEGQDPGRMEKCLDL